MQIFCMHCGGATQYTAIKPDKCGKCSKSFAVAVAPKAAAASAVKREMAEPEPEIKKLQVQPIRADEIIIKNDSKISFSELRANPDAIDYKRDRKLVKRSTKKLVDEFFSEGK